MSIAPLLTPTVGNDDSSDDAIIRLRRRRFTPRSPATFAGRARRSTAVDVYTAIFSPNQAINYAGFPFLTKNIQTLHPFFMNVGTAVGSIGANGAPYTRNLVQTLGTNGPAGIELWRYDQTSTSGVETYFAELAPAIDRDLTARLATYGVSAEQVEMVHLEAEAFEAYTRIVNVAQDQNLSPAVIDSPRFLAYRDALLLTRDDLKTRTPEYVLGFAREEYLQLAERFYALWCGKLRARLPNALITLYTPPQQDYFGSVQLPYKSASYNAALVVARELRRELSYRVEAPRIVQFADVLSPSVYAMYKHTNGPTYGPYELPRSIAIEYVEAMLNDAEALAAAAGGMRICPWIDAQYHPNGNAAHPFAFSEVVTAWDWTNQLDRVLARSPHSICIWGDLSNSAGYAALQAPYATWWANTMAPDLLNRMYA